RSQLAPQPRRPAHMHQPRLDPAFKPSRALRAPGGEILRRLLESRQIDDPDAIAEPLEPHAEIRILRDVVRVPAADRVERAAAEVRPYVAKAPSAFRVI